MELSLPIKLFVLLLLINGSPVVARALLGPRLAAALDSGHLHTDGRPLLGSSKTWAGLATAIVVGGLGSLVLGLGLAEGLLIGLLSMLGDSASSFVKRRRGLAPGAMALGLDQLPEAVLPMLACIPLLGLGLVEAIAVSLAFMLANLLISRLLVRLGFADHPH